MSPLNALVSLKGAPRFIVVVIMVMFFNFIWAAKVPVPPPISRPNRIGDFAVFVIWRNWGIGRSRSDLKDWNFDFSRVRSKPRSEFEIERQWNDLQV